MVSGGEEVSYGLMWEVRAQVGSKDGVPVEWSTWQGVSELSRMRRASSKEEAISR